MSAHRQVTVRHPDGHAVELDEGLSELVQAMWMAQIDTCQSCEDLHGDGYLWVAFGDIADLIRLIEIAGRLPIAPRAACGRE